MKGITVIIALFLTNSCSAQQNNKKHWIDFLKPESVQCYNEVRQIQADCFKNLNLNLTIMDSYFIGRLHPSQVNTSPQEFVNDVCSKRSRFVECVIPAALNKRGKDGCIDGAYFNMAIQELTQRLAMYSNACNKSLFFSSPKEPCMRSILSDTFSCHIKSGMNGHMFTSNGSLQGAVIGADREAAQKYCSKRFELFKCIRGVLEKCPSAREYYIINGYDYDSMEESIHLLCDDTDLYFKGLECFQSPMPSVVKCVNKMTADILDLSIQQYLDDATHEKYYKDYCKIRANHIDCDIKAWEEKCEAVSIGLKNQFQCKMLPKRCQNHKELNINQDVCHKNNFNLHLRSSGRVLVTSYPIILFAVVTSAFKFYF